MAIRGFRRAALVLVVVLCTAWKCENVKERRGASGDLTEDIAALYPPPVAVDQMMSSLGGASRRHCVRIFRPLAALEKSCTSSEEPATQWVDIEDAVVLVEKGTGIGGQN
ncbi:hypothetical protein B0H13DRAFT_1888667 [Mycena leptocephala]|nr:hypothetical protein B0H13DRAFT_1888667 [Mycena leptocephala]